MLPSPFKIARYTLVTLLAIGLLCLALAANAQPPTYLPTLADQYRQQRDEARKQQALTADSLARCRSLLAATREAYQKLDAYRLARIDSLVKAANAGLRQESEARQEAEAQTKLYADFQADLYTSVLSELLRDTALGIGRKKWLKNTRKQIEAFRASNGQHTD